jgi:hypothetical protein
MRVSGNACPDAAAARHVVVRIPGFVSVLLRDDAEHLRSRHAIAAREKVER